MLTVISEGNMPGASELTRILKGRNRDERTAVRWCAAALDAFSNNIVDVSGPRKVQVWSEESEPGKIRAGCGRGGALRWM